MITKNESQKIHLVLKDLAQRFPSPSRRELILDIVFPQMSDEEMRTLCRMWRAGRNSPANEQESQMWSKYTSLRNAAAKKLKARKPRKDGWN